MNRIPKKELSGLSSLLILTGIGIASLVFYLWSLPQQLTFPDAGNFADVARSIFQGHGAQASHYYPCWFNFIRPFSSWVNLEPLLHPLVIVAAFWLLGISDTAVIYASAFFFLLAIPLVYLLAKRVFGKHDLAFIVALVFLCDPLMLYYATSGLSEPLFTFLGLAVILVLYLTKRTVGFYIAGMIAGLFLLCRTQGFFWLPGMAVFIVLSQKKFQPGKKILFFFAGIITTLFIFKVVFTPLLSTGLSYKKISASLAFGTNSFPRETLMRSIVPIGKDFIFTHWREIIFKFWQNLEFFFKQFAFPSLGNLDNPFYRPYYFASPIVIALYLISLFIRGYDQKQQALKVSTLVLVLSNILFCSLAISEIRYLHPLLPLMLLFAAEAIFLIFENILHNPRSQKAALGMLVSFFILLPDISLTMSNYYNYSEKISRWQYQVLAKALSENTQPQEVVLTNLNVWGSWYGERKTIFIPLWLKDIPQIERFTKIDAVFLSSYPPPEEEWMRLIFSPAPFSGFTLVKEDQMLIPEIESRRWMLVKTVLYKRK